MNLKGKSALVTGGAIRIGRAICWELARRGVHVLVHYHRSEREARNLVRQLRSLRVRAEAVGVELKTEADAKFLMEEGVRRMGRLDMLINNAAVFHKTGFRKLTQRELHEEMNTNLVLPLLLIRYFAEACGKSGQVINLLDRRISGHDPTCVPYILSKKALAEATILAALEYAPSIRVNAVAPGAVLPPPGKGKAYLFDAAGPVPLKIRVKPRDVAEAVVSLLQQPTITGQILFVDGGQHATWGRQEREGK